MIENNKQFRLRAARLARLADLLCGLNPADLSDHTRERRNRWESECRAILEAMQQYMEAADHAKTRR